MYVKMKFHDKNIIFATYRILTHFYFTIMAKDNYTRWKILDQMLSSGNNVTFYDAVIEFDKTFRRLNSNIYNDIDHAYGSLFRRDIMTFRKILKDNGISEMLISEGAKRNMTYRYRDAGFSILPYVEYRCSKGDVKSIEDALSIIRRRLPQEIFDNIEFNLKSRFEYEFNNDDLTIDYSENLRLRGRQWLPILYKYINTNVLIISKTDYKHISSQIILHPYLLKLFNGRWYIFGYNECNSNNYERIAIDQINNIEIARSIAFKPKNKRYLDKLNTYIGVTPGMRNKNGDIIIGDVEIIKIGVYEHRAWGRIITKPIHSSQTITKDFSNGYGQISISLTLNAEFFLRILSYGENILIESEHANSIIKGIISNLYSLYTSSSPTRIQSLY